MKKVLILVFIISAAFIPIQLKAQSQEIQQLILNIEKLSQFKKILSDMKKGYELLSKGYKTINDLSEGNFSLHKTFLDALLQVSPAVRDYKRVGEIIHFQILIVKESKNGLNRCIQSGSFTQQEISYLDQTYSSLLTQSLRNIDELTMILTADKLRMSDDERLAAIDQIYLEMNDKISFLKNFNASYNILALQRKKEANDVNALKVLNPLKK